jgi:hypothetical protein
VGAISSQDPVDAGVGFGVISGVISAVTPSVTSGSFVAPGVFKFAASSVFCGGVKGRQPASIIAVRRRTTGSIARFRRKVVVLNM